MESTQSCAFDLAGQGAADRTVVVAEHQTAGRGRRGHHWQDEPGANLLFSIIVRSSLSVARRPLLSFAAAVAVAEALAEVVGVEARLKWPNDVLVSARKVAGILLESRSATPNSGLADGAPTIIGIGVNVAQARFGPELAGLATSLVLESGRTVPRDEVLDSLLHHFDRWRATLERDGFAPVRERWLALAETIGREVRVDGQMGLAVGLDEDGALLLRDADRTHRVVAGTVTSRGSGDD
ncbi:MAG: biotin--[acetyl-CoA-carboxylase] ligase [Candidatus Rokubacteria bacterium 13_1_40CM_68_15]|nr:MAG: biotin--[acetyl-CoA-carboxylase] ligase [Candidatus Rokubacteria bacterium 13_1_40CM_68_15]